MPPPETGAHAPLLTATVAHRSSTPLKFRHTYTAHTVKHPLCEPRPRRGHPALVKRSHPGRPVPYNGPLSHGMGRSRAIASPRPFLRDGSTQAAPNLIRAHVLHPGYATS